MAVLTVIVVFIGLILVCKLYILARCCACVQKIAMMIQNKLMFNSILRAILQTYLATSISMWTSLGETSLSSSKGVTDMGIAIALLLFTLAAPMASLRLLRRKFEQLKDQSFKARFDSLYQNLDYYKWRALPMSSWFFARRLLFAFLIVFCGKSVVL